MNWGRVLAWLSFRYNYEKRCELERREHKRKRHIVARRMRAMTANEDAKWRAWMSGTDAE